MNFKRWRSSKFRNLEIAFYRKDGSELHSIPSRKALLLPETSHPQGSYREVSTWLKNHLSVVSTWESTLRTTILVKKGPVSLWKSGIYISDKKAYVYMWRRKDKIRLVFFKINNLLHRARKQTVVANYIK